MVRNSPTYGPCAQPGLLWVRSPVGLDEAGSPEVRFGAKAPSMMLFGLRFQLLETICFGVCNTAAVPASHESSEFGPGPIPSGGPIDLFPQTRLASHGARVPSERGWQPSGNCFLIQTITSGSLYPSRLLVRHGSAASEMSRSAALYPFPLY
jgi:hypothetical protein